MGYALMTGACVCCGRIFSFNPLKVPSIRVRGKREPLCRGCYDRGQAMRKEKGLEPFPPLDPEAYEACDEAELPYGEED